MNFAISKKKFLLAATAYALRKKMLQKSYQEKTPILGARNLYW